MIGQFLIFSEVTFPVLIDSHDPRNTLSGKYINVEFCMNEWQYKMQLKNCI